MQILQISVSNIKVNQESSKMLDFLNQNYHYLHITTKAL